MSIMALSRVTAILGRSSPTLVRNLSSHIEPYSKFQDLKVEEVSSNVLSIELNRPKQRNAMRVETFNEIKDAFELLHRDNHFRVAIISGSGKMFTSGIDLTALMSLGNIDASDPARKASKMQHIIKDLQVSMHTVYKCQKPVISVIHDGCIGGGMDLISGTDIRICSQDAWFTIKETQLGLAADIGTLQFMPFAVSNPSLFRELVYTGRNFGADEAKKELGFVSYVTPDKESALKKGLEVATSIASLSPIAVQGTKANLLYSRDHSMEDGLHFMTAWNMSMLQSEDLVKAAVAAMSKEDRPQFEDL